jgi:hypothetical protein
LTDELVRLVLGWRLAPNRYLKPDGGWTSRLQFQPFKNIHQALQLLEAVTTNYTLESAPDNVFKVEARLSDRVANTSGKSKSRTITLAVAQLVGTGDVSAKAVAETESRRPPR